MDFTSFFNELKNDNDFKRFYELIVDRNKKFNLTAILNEEEFMIKHVVDSLYFNEFYKKDSSIVEIGSGAGFPSVPIKIKRRDLKFTLVESNEKKCGFLNEVKQELGFSDFSVLCGRAEELSQKEGYLDGFDYAVARAVAPLNVLCELLLPFVKVGGCAVAYKGANYGEEVDSSVNALKTLCGEIAEIKKYSLPSDMGERALIIIKKTAPTPEGFPRRYAKIKKCPL